MKELPDERLVHRLEAFSDIVIGFSLAQLSLVFVMPATAAEIYTDPTRLIAFFFTFATVAALWYSHHRLFASYFVPNRAMILLNFTMLAFTVLLVFTLEMFTHFAPNPGQNVLAGFTYCGAFAIVYGLLGVLFSLGVRAQWSELPAQQRIAGVQSAVRLVTVALAAVAGCVICWRAGWFIGNGFFLIFPAVLLMRPVNARIARSMTERSDG